MIKSTDFITDDARKEAEQLAIGQLLNNFTEAMAQKILLKQEQGYAGWDKPECLEVLKQKLMFNLEKEDMIDVANLAMMIWNLKQA